MKFHVGQKVVCVDASRTWLGKRVPLRHNTIYTIGRVNSWTDPDGDYGVSVLEVAAPDDDYHLPEFKACRFRPVTDNRTDISVFTALLKPQRQTEDA